MRRVIGWVGLLLWPALAAAAPITIKGKVIGSDDGKPIPGAYVMINPTEPDVAKRTVLTGLEGEFTIVSREKSTTLSISFIGYKDYRKPIDPSSGRTIDLGTIRMLPEAITTNEVKVTAQAPMATMRVDTLQY